MTPANTTTTNRYGAIASEIYDLDKQPGKLRDTAFYLQRLADIDGEILEPACGSGRMMIPLLEAGHTVTGFDLSADMLARCAASCAARGFSPELSQAGFDSFEYGRRFAAAILPAGSFTLVGNADEARGVLDRIRRHLAPGGLFLLDMMPLSYLANRADDRRRWTAGNGDLLTLEGIVTRVDWTAQTIERTYRYERWRDNRLLATELDPMIQRLWGLHELTLALEAVGFTVDAVHADYRPGAPPGPESRMLTFEARAA